MPNSIKFIDLFAGIGGIRQGFELACKENGLTAQCVFISEIKPSAIKVLKQNHPNEKIYGDITKIDANEIPQFDILLAGFPCQAFSVAGKRLGFEDTRGTLFFDVARILKTHKPFGFILENVDGLVTHDKENKADKTGKTLKIILETLNELGYEVSWRVLNAKDFGVAQNRKRIYIIGTRIGKPSLENFKLSHTKLNSVLEQGLPLSNSFFIDLILSHFQVDQLYGKSIKDKRGGKNNIHSWDIDYKGIISEEEKNLLNAILKERRKKKWAKLYNIEWMDGMPLTIDFIRSFYNDPHLEDMLEHLVALKYLRKEYPKQLVKNRRIQDPTLPLGYNIVSGKMSFEVGKILDPNSVAPTLVAMDMRHIYVVDGIGIRPLSLREGLRLFGYPDRFKFDVTADEGYDLLGNTVVVPVIKAVSEKLLILYKGDKNEIDCTANL